MSTSFMTWPARSADINTPETNCGSRKTGGAELERQEEKEKSGRFGRKKKDKPKWEL